MQDDKYLTQYAQADHSISFKSRTALPQRTRLQLPLMSAPDPSARRAAHLVDSANVARLPISSQVVQNVTTKDRQSIAAMSGPVQYVLHDGECAVPGTAAYYKSLAFRQRAIKSSVSVLERDFDHSTDEDFRVKVKHVQGKDSLILILGRAGVRRATAQRTVDRRMQRANRRLTRAGALGMFATLEISVTATKRAEAGVRSGTNVKQMK
ncbi:hypothetical protein OPT61_g500 [Boeremia exigua]|uniref:Uncharacterized protein n=1 Tax=Boeremia exigua TaxID=749465 RepID=A0ACC2ITP9_9PLEO|nr:hypothetical protein OPT61_g500 [Boeremia exigua]